jgi:hypothetical protein
MFLLSCPCYDDDPSPRSDDYSTDMDPVDFPDESEEEDD